MSISEEAGQDRMYGLLRIATLRFSGARSCRFGNASLRLVTVSTVKRSGIDLSWQWASILQRATAEPEVGSLGPVHCPT